MYGSFKNRTKNPVWPVPRVSEESVKALNATLQNVDFVSTANGKTAKTFSEQGKWSNMCS